MISLLFHNMSTNNQADYNSIKYIIEIKEVGKQKVITTSYTTNHEVTEQYLINFFGLNNSDVESYKITKHVQK